MLSETTLDLAEKFRQNWQTYLNMEKIETRNLHINAQKRINKNSNTNIADPEDDSLTNLNWLQNLNLFSISQPPPPLSPSPTLQMPIQTPQFPLSIHPMNQLNRIMPPYFESSSIYAEVAMNLEFMNDEASVNFFKMNNQLRPPFSDINLISMAIHSYNKMKVSFPEIYQWIEETFPYYKSLPDDWKTGIKNHLTLSKCFQKVPRKKDEAEKGGFWRFSNDFLNYLERNRLQRVSNNGYTEKVENRFETIAAMPKNQFVYKFGKIINRKRVVNPNSAQDENRNSAFRIPKRRWYVNDRIDQNGQPLSNTSQAPNLHQMTADMNNYKSMESIFFQYQDNPRQSICGIGQLSIPITSGTNDPMSSIAIPTVALSTADMGPQLQESNNLFHNTVICSPMTTVATNNTNSPCPEQLTEEEFLSGQAFNNNYITLNGGTEHMPSLLDSQSNFNTSDFNVSDLSITGIGLKPPEWWNQSFSASQISLSKFNCSFRSLTVANNTETAPSPFCVNLDEDHHGVWSTDLSNLAELDVLFGLS